MQRHVGRAVDRDLDHPGAGRERLAEVGERVDPPVRKAEERGSAPEVELARRAQQGLELVGVELRGLGEEIEDPAAAVGDDHDPHRGVDVGQGREPAEVVQEPEVAGDDHRGPPARRRGADPGRDEPVDPVGATVGEKEQLGIGALQERLLVADRHAGRGVDELAVRVQPAQRCLQARLGRFVKPLELGPDRGAHPAVGIGPGASPALLADRAVEPLRDRGRERPRARANDRPGRPGRLVPAVGGVDHELRHAVELGQPLAQRFAGRQLAEAQDEVGRELARSRAGHRLVGADHVRAVVGPAAQLGGRLGEDRQPRGASPRRRSHRRPRRRAAARRRLRPGASPEAARPRPRSARSAGGAGAGGTVVSGRPPSRPSSASARDAVTSPGRGSGPRGSRHGTLRWTGPGRGSPAAVQNARQATERKCRRPSSSAVVGADLAEPAHGRAVELQLVDRLPGADSAELRRAVGGEDDQRDRRLVGLADGRVKVRRRGPRGAEDGRGAPGGLRRAEGEERRRALVDDHPCLGSEARATAPPPVGSSAIRG